MRTVSDCVKAKIATGEIVHIDASLIRAQVSFRLRARRRSGRLHDDVDHDAKLNGIDPSA